MSNRQGATAKKGQKGSAAKYTSKGDSSFRSLIKTPRYALELSAIKGNIENMFKSKSSESPSKRI